MRTKRDTIWLDKFVASLKGGYVDSQAISQMEFETLNEVQNKIGDIPQNSWSSIDDDIFFPKDKTQYQDGEGKGIARCVGTVQTSPERLLGW